MDLTTLITELNAGNVEGPQHFLDLALTIFQNSIDYNAGHQGKLLVAFEKICFNYLTCRL